MKTKNRIYYFTGTGNSLLLAKYLADEIGDCELVSMSQSVAAGNPVLEGERVGLVFPVYCWGPPVVVRRFVQQATVKGSPWLFAATDPAGSAGGTLRKLEKWLRRKGRVLQAGRVFLMPNNYIIFSGADDKETIRAIIEKAAAGIADFASVVKKKKSEPVQRGSLLGRVFTTGLVYNLAIPFFRRMDRHFKADDACNQCGICEKICPVHNISLVDGRPVWNRHCEQCLACLQYCPEQAIQWMGFTRKRARYRNPDVTLKEMLAQAGRSGHTKKTNPV